jgi:hypothetical protein
MLPVEDSRNFLMGTTDTVFLQTQDIQVVHSNPARVASKAWESSVRRSRCSTTLLSGASRNVVGRTTGARYSDRVSETERVLVAELNVTLLHLQPGRQIGFKRLHRVVVDALKSEACQLFSHRTSDAPELKRSKRNVMTNTVEA